MAITKRATKPKRRGLGFRTIVYSRHPSHRPLRTLLERLPFRSMVRLGSINPGPGDNRVFLNSVDAIRNASDKLRMKRCFTRHNIPSAVWVERATGIPPEWWENEGKVVMKNRFGSRGQGLYLINNPQDIQRHYHNEEDQYIFEKFYDYSREYRLHVTKDGCFCAWRKVLREETPQEDRWIRNDSTCNWVGPTHQLFDRPSNWNEIERACVEALQAVGLDIGGCDVKVQSAITTKGKRREAPKFFILEINSACSHAEQTRAAYLTQIPRLLREKHDN